MLQPFSIRVVLPNICFIAIKGGRLMKFFALYKSCFFSYFDCLKRLLLVFDLMFIAAPFEVDLLFRAAA